jgi:hypothetical protein
MQEHRMKEIKYKNSLCNKQQKMLEFQRKVWMIISSKSDLGINTDSISMNTIMIK